ncbi:MAG: hypothetical protein GYB65_18335, partial [Chloroflexi bacterium]|nr:hypothetical protein [Chloroflexota bacterium]
MAHDIQAALDNNDIERARELVQTALQDNPDADTYYYAALVADNADDKADYLRQALVQDPVHADAQREL